MWPNIDPNREIPNIPPTLFLSLSRSLTVCRVLAEPTQLTISTKSLTHRNTTMASKTLARTGASLVNRFLSNPFLRQSPNPNPNQRIVSQGLDVTPKLFPSLSKFENSLHLPQYQNDAELIRKVASEGFVYPSGLPSLSFYLPEGTLSLSLSLSLFLSLSLSLCIYMCVCVKIICLVAGKMR